MAVDAVFPVTLAHPAVERLVEASGVFALPGDCPLHVAWARLQPDAWGRRRIASGRGQTPEKAHLSALTEAMERSSAVIRPSEPAVRISLGSAGDMAVMPNSVMLISDRQYSKRSEWNHQVPADHHLPEPLDPQREIEWVNALDGTGGTRLVAAAQTFLGYPGSLDHGFTVPDSSGLAAGANRDDAITRGFLELVERDAVAMWWYGRCCRPALQIPSNAAPLVEAFSAWLAQADRRLTLLDLTHDFEIPVVAAISANREGCDLSLGFAASPSLEPAVAGALGELLQFDLTKSLQVRNIHADGSTPSLVDWCRTASLKHHAFLRPHGKPIARQDWSSLTPALCAQLCAMRGLELLSVDLTREDIGIPVVRVIVPGLRPHWPRFAKGRLYDVPQHLGWRSAPLSENELNPTPIIY